MSKKILTTPISAEDLADIKIGDVIYLSGHIVTCRDVPHRRVVQECRELPIDIAGGAILHAGPIIRKTGEKSFEMVSVGRLRACGWRNLSVNLSLKRACA